jgi:hypothetical protein
MALKAVNRYTSNEFHDWQRRALPAGLVIQDIDAWAVAVATSDYAPVALIELKRSHISVEAWRPFAADRPNLAALLSLAAAARVPLFIVYFQKDRAIDDDTPLAVFLLEAATPSYRGFRKVLSAREFAARFPRLTGPLAVA